MQSLRWHDVSVFLAVLRAGSLGRAAKALGVNHSTIWRRMNAMSEALGVAVVVRTPTGYALTLAGAAILPHAERVEEEVFALQRAAAGTNAVPAGPVVVTAPESMAPVLTPLLFAFRARHPNITVELRTGDRFFDLDRREADVAVRPGPAPPENTVGRRVCGVAWTVYGPAELDDEEARALPWLAYSESLSRLAAVRWRKSYAAHPVLLTVSTVPAMAIALRHGQTRGMLPCFVGDGVEGIRRLKPPLSEAASALWLLVHADLSRAARVRLFVDHAWESLVANRAMLEG